MTDSYLAKAIKAIADAAAMIRADKALNATIATAPNSKVFAELKEQFEELAREIRALNATHNKGKSE
jgi:hypothetical protein